MFYDEFSRFSFIMSSEKKLILVIGATGAQGMAVIPAILGPSEDGTPSPYTVRALTRDPTNRRALELESIGVECFKGNEMFATGNIWF
jgi:uncharacterized protein YbjT (DUF2867 family)